MPIAFPELLEGIQSGSYNLQDLWYIITTFFQDLMNSEHIVELKEMFTDHLGFLVPYIPYFILGCSLVICLFGNRTFSFWRFSITLIVSFPIGIYFLAPPILEVLKMPAWVIGLLVGLVIAIFSKIVVALLLAFAVGYPVYMVCISGTFIPALTRYTEGNWIFAFGVCAVFVLVAFLLHKLIKYMGTAMLGGYGIALVIKGWYDYTTIPMFEGIEWVGILVVTLIFAIIGMIVQYKVREKY